MFHQTNTTAADAIFAALANGRMPNFASYVSSGNDELDALVSDAYEAYEDARQDCAQEWVNLDRDYGTDRTNNRRIRAERRLQAEFVSRLKRLGREFQRYADSAKQRACNRRSGNPFANPACRPQVVNGSSFVRQNPSNGEIEIYLNGNLNPWLDNGRGLASGGYYHDGSWLTMW